MSVEDEADEIYDDPIEFDEIALISLCQIFNKQEKWKQLAKHLNFDNKINIWDNSSNPTKMILREIEREQITQSRLFTILKNLKETDAFTEFDAMIVRQSEPDF